MASLSLQIPESLHQRLAVQARREGVSLSQYLVYLLTQQARPGYTVEIVPEDEVERQKASYRRFLEELGSASHQEIRAALDAREPGEPEQDLDQDLVDWLKQSIADRAAEEKATAA